MKDEEWEERRRNMKHEIVLGVSSDWKWRREQGTEEREAVGEVLEVEEKERNKGNKGRRTRRKVEEEVEGEEEEEEEEEEGEMEGEQEGQGGERQLCKREVELHCIVAKKQQRNTLLYHALSV